MMLTGISLAPRAHLKPARIPRAGDLGVVRPERGTDAPTSADFDKSYPGRMRSTRVSPPDPRRHVARWLAERLLNHAEQGEREVLGQKAPGPILTDILNLPVDSH